MSPHRLLWTAIDTRRRDLVLASVLLSTHQLGESLVPVIVGATLGKAVLPGRPGALVLWLGLLALDFLVLSLSYRHGARAAMRARQHAEHSLRGRLAAQVVAPTGASSLGPGELLTRASSDAARVGVFARQFASSTAAVVVLVTSTVLLLRLSLLLGAIVLAGTVLQLVAQRRAWALLNRHTHREQEQQARAAVLAEDLIRGLRVLKGIRAESAAADRYADASRAASRAAMQATSTSAAVDALAALLSGLFLTLVAGVGGWLTLHHHLALGEFVGALGLARFVIGPMEVVSGVAAAYARALASAQRVADVLEERTDPEASPDTDVVATADGGITLEVPRPRGGRPLRLTLMPKELVGLVCSDPGDPDRLQRALASVAADGVLVAPHEAVLLPGTIAENVAIAASAPALVGLALAAASVDEVVEAAPDGAQTLVGERGEALSGGQRQRVALARALAAGPPVLVLLGPTSAVDPVTEDRIADGVRRLRGERTTLVVTTSPAWLSRCDRVVLWDAAGTVTGTHAALMTTDERYRRVVTR